MQLQQLSDSHIRLALDALADLRARPYSFDKRTTHYKKIRRLQSDMEQEAHLRWYKKPPKSLEISELNPKQRQIALAGVENILEVHSWMSIAQLLKIEELRNELRELCRQPDVKDLTDKQLDIALGAMFNMMNMREDKPLATPFFNLYNEVTKERIDRQVAMHINGYSAMSAPVTEENSNLSKITNSEIGSQHWYNTLLSKISHIGERMRSGHMSQEETMHYSLSLIESSRELMNGYKAVQDSERLIKIRHSQLITKWDR